MTIFSGSVDEETEGAEEILAAAGCRAAQRHHVPTAAGGLLKHYSRKAA